MEGGEALCAGAEVRSEDHLVGEDCGLSLRESWCSRYEVRRLNADLLPTELQVLELV